MSNCRICGKKIPSLFRPYHEKIMCLRMRKLRGDADVLMRELPKISKPLEEIEPGQKRLNEFAKL